ncbi:MAG: hypothetical protein QM610_10435 [Chitinophagaceae bacterium]
MDNKIVVILGMHRSGTSLIAGWLHNCGLYVGQRLLGAGIGNLDGHYEDLDFLEHHENLLQAHDLPPDGLTTHDLPPLRENEMDQLRALIQTKNDAHGTWGWKEPRTCLFTGVYRQLIPDAFYVIVFRDYKSVVSSLITRLHKATIDESGLSRRGFKAVWTYFKRKKRLRGLLSQHATHNLQIWIHYNKKILEHIQQIPAHQYRFVNQDALLQSGISFIEDIKIKWQLDGLQYVPLKQRYKKKLQSHVLRIAPYIQDKRLLTEAKALQSQLIKMLDA